MAYYNFNYWIFMLPAFVLVLAAQWYVNSSYRTWSQVRARSQKTGAEAAQRLMLVGQVNDIRIEGVSGQMTDHYDPQHKVLRLSEGTAGSQSVAALAIAAHELGHAQQDQEGYLLLRLRTILVPAVNIGSYLGWILIMIGLLIRMTDLAWIGVLVFSGGALLSIATLPVELDASARARRMLTESGLIAGEDEVRGVNTVLTAAALTYVAALATAVLQLLYYVSLVGGFGDRRRR